MQTADDNSKVISQAFRLTLVLLTYFQIGIIFQLNY